MPLPLHEAIREAYKGQGLTQDAVARNAEAADLVVRDSDGTVIAITQAKLSKWSNGVDRPKLEWLPMIEAACGRPKGWILHAAGYLDDVVPDVPSAAAMDPRLSADARQLLITLYETLVKQTAGAADQEE